MKDTLLDQFSSSGKNRLDKITIKKKTSVMVRASDGSMQQRLKEIKIPYEVPCVTSGMRILYYLVELIFLVISGIGLFMALATLGLINESLLTIPGVDKLFGALVVFLYYIQEAINGKSIAKMFFGYSVINVYAEKPTFKEVLIRSISRIVPFEGVSCMSKPSRGWHDKWSGTYVVADNDLSQIREMLETEELQ